MSTDTQESPNAEFTSLKHRAEMMGVKFHPNISLEKLRAKVDAALDEAVPTDKEVKKPVKTKRESAFEMVRVRVMNMDQNKSNQNGVIITAGNSKIGTVKKYIPFDTEWHVPRIIYNVLKEKKHQVFATRKDNKGNEITESKLMNAYAVEVLEPLTEAELKDLAQRQAMAKGTS